MAAYRVTAKAQRVLTWYRVYCGALAAWYLAAFAVCLVGLFAGGGADERDALERAVFGVLVAAFCVPAGAVFALGVLLPRKPWTWIYGLVLLCLGMTTVCCLPACIPLLVAWLGDDVKRAFGRAGGRDGAPDDPWAGG